jgi:hypothetical protein
MLNRCSNLEDVDCAELREQAVEIQSRFYQIGLSQLQLTNFNNESSTQDSMSQSASVIEDMEIEPEWSPNSRTTNPRPKGSKSRKRKTII